jgi:hypothetical protein
LRRKSTAGVRAVAKRLVIALTAATESDDGAASQVGLLAARIIDLKVAFNAQRAVVTNGDFDRHFSVLLAAYLPFFEALMD